MNETYTIYSKAQNLTLLVQEYCSGVSHKLTLALVLSGIVFLLFLLALHYIFYLEGYYEFLFPGLFRRKELKEESLKKD